MCSVKRGVHDQFSGGRGGGFWIKSLLVKSFPAGYFPLPVRHTKT